MYILRKILLLCIKESDCKSQCEAGFKTAEHWYRVLLIHLSKRVILFLYLIVCSLCSRYQKEAVLRVSEVQRGNIWPCCADKKSLVQFLMRLGGGNFSNFSLNWNGLQDRTPACHQKVNHGEINDPTLEKGAGVRIK